MCPAAGRPRTPPLQPSGASPHLSREGLPTTPARPSLEGPSTAKDTSRGPDTLPLPVPSPLLLVLQAPDPPPSPPGPLMAPLKNSCLLVQSDQGLAFSAVQLLPTRPEPRDGKCKLEGRWAHTAWMGNLVHPPQRLEGPQGTCRELHPATTRAWNEDVPSEVS